MMRLLFLVAISLWLFMPTGYAEEAKFPVRAGKLLIEEVGNEGMYVEYNFKYEGVIVGSKLSLSPEVWVIDQSGSDHYRVVVSAPPGGSACAEEVAVFTLKEYGWEISPSLSFCGGLRDVSVNVESGSLRLSGADRDDSPIFYEIDTDGAVKYSGGAMLMRSFFD